MFFAASPAYAVHWTSSLAGPSTWKYDLTFDPFDNYSISQTNTTITMTGLTGVTAAAGPTSTDFDEPLNTTNLAWTAQVLNGGTKVVWTHVGGGTGNFGTAKHAYGFSITAASSHNGSVPFATNGFQTDGNGPFLDISGTVAGPAGAGAPATVPAASPLTLVLTIMGLGSVGAYLAGNRLQQRG